MADIGRQADAALARANRILADAKQDRVESLRRKPAPPNGKNRFALHA
jgi:hypothetical protein